MNPRTRSIQCHNTLVFISTFKPPNTVMNIYEGHIYDLKTRVDIWKSMDVVPVEYVTLAQM